MDKVGEVGDCNGDLRRVGSYNKLASQSLHKVNEKINDGVLLRSLRSTIGTPPIM